MSERIFPLPFESNDDELGPWDVLLSNYAISDMRKLEPLTVKAVMEKLMAGKWSEVARESGVKRDQVQAE